MAHAYTSLRVLVGGTSTSIRCSPPPGVALIELTGRNGTLGTASFAELPDALASLAATPDVRAIVLASAAKHFCTGADLAALAGAAAIAAADGGDPAAGRAALLALIRTWQTAFTAMEACPLPVVAAVHGACVGAGVDLVTAADVRVASPDAAFCVKEVDLGIVADLGTLQRLRLLVGDGVARDWSLTARTVGAEEAARAGLVSRVASGRPGAAGVRDAAFEVAASLAAKPPRALAGTKSVLLAARDQTVAAGLEWVALWNGGGALPSAEVSAALGRARL
jgi:enoyl-CoA hydratase/carnithine racemase